MMVTKMLPDCDVAGVLPLSNDMVRLSSNLFAVCFPNHVVTVGWRAIAARVTG